jgi:hypothetical protein
MHTIRKFSTLRPHAEDPEVSESMQCTHLRDVEEQEGHHEREKTSGLSEGETQNGVLEELTPEGRVAGDTLDEATENRSNTNTGTGKTDGSETGTLDLGGSDHGGGGRLNDDTTLLDHVAGGVVAERGADNEAVGGSGLAGCEVKVNGWIMGWMMVMELNGSRCFRVCTCCERATTYQRWRSRGRPRGRRRRNGRWQPF